MWRTAASSCGTRMVSRQTVDQPSRPRRSRQPRCLLWMHRGEVGRRRPKSMAAWCVAVSPRVRLGGDQGWTNGSRSDSQRCACYRRPSRCWVGVLLPGLSQLTLGPSWLPPSSRPRDSLTIASLWDTRMAADVIGLVTITIAVAAAAVFLIRQLVEGPVKGSYLLTGAGAIWAANLLTSPFGIGRSTAAVRAAPPTATSAPISSSSDARRRHGEGLRPAPSTHVRRVQREHGVQPDGHADPVEAGKGLDDGPGPDRGDRRRHWPGRSTLG